MTESGKLRANISFCYSGTGKEPCATMHISSPFFVVPVIIAIFAVSILFSTSSKEDESHSAH